MHNFTIFGKLRQTDIIALMQMQSRFVIPVDPEQDRLGAITLESEDDSDNFSVGVLNETRNYPMTDEGVERALVWAEEKINNYIA